MSNQQKATTSELYFVPTTHWDREWYRPFSEFQFHLVELMDMVLDMLENNESINSFHADGYTAIIEDYLEKRPENSARIKKLVAADKLEIGPWYIQSDMLLPSGESLIRNLEIGIQASGKFGGKRAIPYSPDAFGHSADIPAILNLMGFDTYFFCRGLGNHIGKTAAEFAWEAPGGASILALAGIVNVFDPPFDGSGKWLCGAYGLGMDLPLEIKPLSERISLILEHMAGINATSLRLAMCGCDHLLPQQKLDELIENYNAIAKVTKCSQGTLTAYVARLKKLLKGKTLPVVQGELADGRYFWILAGTGSSRNYLKRMNFLAQNILEAYVEPWTAFMALRGSANCDVFVDDCWKELLRNQSHDSLCGCSTDKVHRDMERRFENIFGVSERLLTKAFRYCAGDKSLPYCMPVDGEILMVAAFSGTPWNYKMPFTAEIFHPADISLDGYRAYDASGKTIAFVSESVSEGFTDSGPFMPSGKGRLMVKSRIAVDAANIPAYGRKTLFFRKSDNPARKLVSGNPVLLQNEFLTVDVARDGTISIRLEGEKSNTVFKKLLWFEDEADIGDEYVFIKAEGEKTISTSGIPAMTRILLDNDFVQQIEIRHRLLCPVKFDTKSNRRSRRKRNLIIRNILTLYKGIKRLDIRTEIDNNCLDHRLRVCFELPEKVGKYFVQTQFGLMERDLALPKNMTDWREKSTLCRRHFGWLAFPGIADTSSGMAIFSKGIHEHEFNGENLKLTLMRSVGCLGVYAGPRIATPEAQCQGKQVSEYAMYFYRTDALNSNLLWKEYQSYARPPELRILSPAADVTVEPEEALLELISDRLVLSSIRRGESNNELRITIFNPTTKNGNGMLKSDFKLHPGRVIRPCDTGDIIQPENIGVPPGKILMFSFPVSTESRILLTCQ